MGIVWANDLLLWGKECVERRFDYRSRDLLEFGKIAVRVANLVTRAFHCTPHFKNVLACLRNLAWWWEPSFSSYVILQT